jgi:two-component sensor histidine kinase
MIADPKRLMLAVKVDDSAVTSDVSVSLGLIVTELVINALKHAFTDQPKGTINVDYHASGDDWTLSVADDGIGMPAGIDAPKAGLGTGIVEALAKNLAGEITVSAAEPGTVVTIRHRRSADLGRSLSPAA